MLALITIAKGWELADWWWIEDRESVSSIINPNPLSHEECPDPHLSYCCSDPTNTLVNIIFFNRFGVRQEFIYDYFFNRKYK